MPYRLGLVDWNGTIADDLAITYAATRHLFEHFAPNVSVPTLKEHRIGCSAMGMFDWYYQRGIPRTVVPNTLRKEWMAYYDGHCETLKLSEGAEKFLKLVGQCDIPLILLSAAPKATRHHVERLGILDCFDRLIFEAYDKSPVVKSLAERENINPRDIFFIGDTVSDVRQGNAAGVDTFAYTQGYHPVTALLDAKPNYRINSFGDALGIIRAQMPQYA